MILPRRGHAKWAKQAASKMQKVFLIMICSLLHIPHEPDVVVDPDGTIPVADNAAFPFASHAEERLYMVNSIAAW